MTLYVPTLSRAAWAKSPADRIDFLLADFFTSEYSQSYLYSGNITSLTHLIQKYQGNITGLVDNMRIYLESYLESYLEDIMVDVTSDAGTITNPTSAVNVTIFIQFSENGRIYSAGRLIETIDSKLKRIVNLNNTGTM